MLSRSILNSSNWASLRGKVAVVTGGGAGIGLMIAKGLVANGAKVYIADVRAEVTKKVAHENGLMDLHMDVTSKNSIAKAVKVVTESDGKLDILVNNAGIPGPTSPYLADIFPRKDSEETISNLLFREHDFKSWTDVFSVNTFGPFFVTAGFLPLLEAAARTQNLVEGETSSVINISSAAGSLKSGMIAIPYGTTKAALEHLTTVMAAEFGRNKIPVRVNGIAPGIFVTEMNPQAAEVAKGPLPGGINPAPLKRPGRDHEIAAAAIFLASSGGTFTNGITIRVDGGHNLVNP
ncbi:hypothetical protein D9758_005277 [Tetrapyrgos nigripes]|uniref:Uncharacterized protein n=1 Tax=Tetrapyrgos nigripes TaxID=182062 RepID=A0A8H5GX18_9AGAR|nr:hypothetical protein D9758_005277 [Tetrapyrgos nigripes]